uniref:Uncharacterized protein n=1 Tax=Peronospora matthiolae TaxID=2874970 RepID=A0AAV1T0M1_9STRA
MIVEGKQKIPGFGAVVKQQLNGHGPHANHRDLRNGPWSDLGSYPSGGRQIVGNPPIPWLLEWRKIVEVHGRENSVSHLARRKGDAVFAIRRMAIRKRSGLRRRTNRASLAVCLPCRRYLHVFYAAIILNFDYGDSRDRSGWLREKREQPERPERGSGSKIGYPIKVDDERPISIGIMQHESNHPS